MNTTQAQAQGLAERWKTYLLERSPPGPLLMITAGISLAPMAIRRQFEPGLWCLGTLAGYAILAQMRLGDELKDLDKDRRLHPERPLPRGLLSPAQAMAGMRLLIFGLVAAGAALFVAGHGLGGILLVLSTLFAWLMFKEFFIGATLAREPMTYALTHQVIVFAVYGWIGAVYGREFLCSRAFLGWLICNFCASFNFEICRKLDPGASPEAGTYLRHYGPGWTTLFCAVFIALSVASGFWMENTAWLLPAQLLMAATLLLIPLRPRKFKAVEGIAILFATWMLWYPAIQWAWAAWRGRAG